jgi:hypothetical protein
VASWSPATPPIDNPTGDNDGEPTDDNDGKESKSLTNLIFWASANIGSVLDVLTSESNKYDVTYAWVPDETPISNVMHEAAIAIGEKQQVDYLLANIDVENKHQQLSGQARMSISNLLNPVPNIKPSQPSLSKDFLSEQNESKFQLVLMAPNGINQALNCNLMITLRKEHNTENHKTHSGNERKKRQNFLLPVSDWPESNLDSTQVPQPSECSKLVALVLKQHSTQQSTIARMHRWNIQVKFNFSKVRNTSTHVDVNAQLLVQGGSVLAENPLTCGKYGVIIKDKVRSDLLQPSLVSLFLILELFHSENVYRQDHCSLQACFRKALLGC